MTRPTTTSNCNETGPPGSVAAHGSGFGVGDAVLAKGWYRKDRPTDTECFDSWQWGYESAIVTAVTETGYQVVTGHGHNAWVSRDAARRPNA
jgi:hypothetical protein